MSSYKSFFNPTNMLVVVALLALILFRHSLFPEATESTEVKQLMGKMDEVINDMQSGDETNEQLNTPASESSNDTEPNAPQQMATSKESGDEEKPAKSFANAPEVTDGVDNEAAALTVWQTARRAAWDGNSDAAVENYRALVNMQPGNYDAYGEMGNVLMQQGDTQGAIEAYSHAALLLGKSGYPQAAWHVMNIVARFDQAKAQQLHETLYGKPLPVMQ